jgi:DNA-binding transcriptional regulator LsrR (DeoR family)
MARRTFRVADIVEILVRWHAGVSQSEIAENLGIDRKTVGKYISAAMAAGIETSGPLRTDAEWEARLREWFPELADTTLRRVTWTAIEPYREYIATQLGSGAAVSAIYRRLHDEHGLPVSIASFRRYIAMRLPQLTAARRC